FSTCAIDALSLDAGITTSTCRTSWALRMRISMSAIGSLMLIDVSLPSFLPTCLDHAWYFAAQRQVAQLVAPQAELAVHAARPAGQRAAVAQAHRGGVARQLLQLVAGRVLGLVGGARVVDHLEQNGAPRLELLDGPAALLVAELECELGHAWVLQCLNGKRNAASSARASPSVFAVVVIAMFIPRSVSILRSEEHTSELQSRFDLVCRLLLEKK